MSQAANFHLDSPAVTRDPGRTAMADFPCPYLTPKGAAIALLAAVLLCWPMLVTTAPLIYFDTISYYSNGEQIWLRLGRMLFAPPPLPGAGTGAGTQAMASAAEDAAAASVNLRSLPYAAIFYPSASTPLGLVLTCILQTTVTLWVFIGLAPPLSAHEKKLAGLGALGVGTLTTLPWFASYAMPDILVAALPAYYTLGLRRADGLGLFQLMALLAIAIFVILAHYGHIPLAVGLALCVLAWRTYRRRLTWFAAVYCLLPIILAVGINMASSAALAAFTSSPAAAEAKDHQQPGLGGSEAQSGQVSITPNRLPLMLARSLADGPGLW